MQIDRYSGSVVIPSFEMKRTVTCRTWATDAAVEVLPLLATLVVVMATMTSRDTRAEGVAHMQCRPGASLLHLAVDNSTGFVYVGAVDRIYQLSADRLEPISVAVTGNRRLYQCHISNWRRVCMV